MFLFRFRLGTFLGPRMCPSLLAGYGVEVKTYARFARGNVDFPRRRHRCTIRYTVFFSIVRLIVAAVAADGAVAFMFIILPKSISEISGCSVQGLQGSCSHTVLVAFAFNKKLNHILASCHIALLRSEEGSDTVGEWPSQTVKICAFFAPLFPIVVCARELCTFFIAAFRGNLFNILATSPVDSGVMKICGYLVLFACDGIRPGDPQRSA